MGILTIKDYNETFRSYALACPNEAAKNLAAAERIPLAAGCLHT